jgi:hypothetical protein
MRHPVLLCFAAFVLGAGCDSPRAGSEPSSRPAPPGSQAAATASARARPEPSGDAAPFGAQLTGRWAGSYRASRVAITMPAGLPSGAWEHDDGARASGEGHVELEVGVDSEVRGTLDGALGQLELRGMVEGDGVRAGVGPRDPLAEPAMSGILTAERQAEELVGELRVSSQDGSLVRSSPVRLQRRP